MVEKLFENVIFVAKGDYDKYKQMQWAGAWTTLEEDYIAFFYWPQMYQFY
jgi:hypothetical protein